MERRPIMRPIVLATDGSPTGRAATEVALRLAEESGRELVAVTVCDVSSNTVGYGFVPAVPDWSELQKEYASEVLKEVEVAASADGVPVETVMLRGLAADEIVRFADEREAELIVIGSRGWGAVRRLLFGSVSSGVLHHAQCPVLVVPAVATEIKEPADVAQLVEAG
jgi:nucleotide-binding universal stress UspA family protein